MSGSSGFTTEPGATPRVRTMPARDLERLTREIADAKQWFGLKATTPVRSCYEAGRDGFWLHRYLTSRGIANVVVDSSSIEVNRRLRRAKSDALDAAALPRGRARRVERSARAHGRGGGSAPAASRAPDLEAGTHAGGEPDERPAREPGPLAAAGYRRRGRGEDGAPVGRLARARGAAGPVGAGMGARAIPAHADSSVSTRTPARDCPRARRGHRQSPAAAPPARGRAERRVGLCERVLRVATVPEPQGGRGGGGAHADAVPKWRRTSGTRDQQGGKSAHPGSRHRAGLVLVAVSAAEPPEPMVSGAVRPRRSTSPQGGDRGPRPEVVNRAVALPRVRRGAGGRTAEDGVTGRPVGAEERRSDGAIWWEPLDNGTGPDAKA